MSIAAEPARPLTASHGQLADNPAQIPPKGWRDVIFRVVHEVMDDRAMLIAAGATYYMLIALVPGLSLFVTLYGLFNDPSDVSHQVSLLAGVLPQGGLDILNDQLTRLTATGKPTLGLTLVISLAVALWSANAGVQSLFDAMNIAYDEEEKRNFFVRTGLGFLFTLAFAIAAILFLAVIVIVPVVLKVLYLGTGFEWLLRIISYLLMLVLLLLGIAALYRWGPSRHDAKWRWITPGAALAGIGIAIVSVAFSWYAANFSNYNATYGSLGALIGFLTWMWLSATIVIVGAELDSELEHQTARDSTTGPDQPIGTRGAYMADHVAHVGSGAAADGKSAPASREPVGRAAPAERSDVLVGLGLMALLLLASGKAGETKRR